MFNFGTAKQSSVGQSTQQSSANSFQNSSSTSSGSSLASSVSRSGQSVAFEDFFAGLYGDAANATAATVANAPLFSEEAAQLFSGGRGFLDSLRELPNADYMNSRLNGPDVAAEAQIGALGNKLGKFFDERLMPAITSRGVSTGTLGGARQGVSIGRAAGEVGDSYSQGVASILANSQAQRDALATTAGNQAIGSAQVGLNALPGLTDIAQTASTAGLSPYLMLAQILGGPTTLGTSESSSQSSSEQIAEAISQALSNSVSSGQSTQKSSGKSLQFGFGFGEGAVG